MLIFFDDILVYSSSLENHTYHLKKVFEEMRSNSLFAKESKCTFATDKVENLGHYIEGRGISTNPNKVKAVSEWPKTIEFEIITWVSWFSWLLHKIC